MKKKRIFNDLSQLGGFYQTASIKAEKDFHKGMAETVLSGNPTDFKEAMIEDGLKEGKVKFERKTILTHDQLTAAINQTASTLADLETEMNRPFKRDKAI